MVPEFPFPVEQPNDGAPFLGDLVVLRPSVARHAPAAEWFLIVDFFNGDADSGLFEINLPAGHPQWMDWAQVVDRYDVAAVIRHSPEGAQTWQL
ncbi:DUF6211 family protein (plasmid) [Kitasatospora sp. NBC_01246]|uniref:DUF6211 family protein n=1 Tax=Kitasatospora sp. NBC_01246 TaxID=2903570 RepID=UPI002E30F0F3|nr:DUF6211 family protein [Kitasatospora sp. NBC_01246]